ncbi:MAG: FeoC-like transcriptional regulator [Jatrophihabitans sp.]|uniref:FeoC-like transcriptional regulator n=1 Tax=Jatrophihabitans sp. TaxID=1932789 RepID=UPI003F7E09A7
MRSPLRSVLDAIADGARSRHDLVTRTGLPLDVVDAAVEHLVRIGRLESTELAAGCPGGGCGSCASGVGDTPGCGASGPSPVRSGRALVQIGLPGRR